MAKKRSYKDKTQLQVERDLFKLKPRLQKIYSQEERGNIMQMADQIGIRAAGRLYNCAESTIRDWKKKAAILASAAESAESGTCESTAEAQPPVPGPSSTSESPRNTSTERGVLDRSLADVNVFLPFQQGIGGPYPFLYYTPPNLHPHGNSPGQDSHDGSDVSTPSTISSEETDTSRGSSSRRKNKFPKKSPPAG